MIKVSRRGGFSDRQGIKSENTEIQLKDLDTRTRTQIYNLINAEFELLYNGAGKLKFFVNKFMQAILLM